MVCFSPLSAYRKAGGGVTFAKSEGYTDRPHLSVACGQCLGCRLERSRQWALRCVHEASLHESNCFVTLTYRDEDLPPAGGLEVRDWQLFAKRARKRLGRFRFFGVGEYGEQNLRPHFHACLFGVDLPDKRPHSARDQVVTYSSDLLDELWGHGFTTVGAVTWQSAAYCARYALKKVTGDRAAEHYSRVDLVTGEVHQVRPEFVLCSRRPGLGLRWFEKYRSDVFPDDGVVWQGKRHGVPDYYFGRLSAEESSPLKAARVKRARKRAKDATPERLVVRETVLRARLRNLRREI